MPYSGISTGWGWGGKELSNGNMISKLFPEGMFSGNSIINNRLDKTLMLIEDGGAIYCLGRQDGQKIMGNYITNCCEFAIYLDNGSAGSLVRDNVVINSYYGFKLNLGYDCTFFYNYQENISQGHILAAIDHEHSYVYEKAQPPDEIKDSVINTCGVRAPYKTENG